MSRASRAIVLVTGTDTGVGKTRVSRGILRALARAGHSVIPLKLVETGCEQGPEGLIAADGEALARAAGRTEQLAIVAPERFRMPAAPTTAARAEGRTLKAAELQRHLDRSLELSPRVLLEGAGGLLVPFAERATLPDLLAGFSTRAIVVARDALGTLNHTCLTVEAARRRGIRVDTVVLNPTSAERSDIDHRSELQQLLPDLTVLGPLPFDPDADDDRAADQLANAGMSADVLLQLWNA